MQCTNPYYLKDEKISVPCGGCISCRISHTREWAVRLVHESSYHPTSLFLTLTYEEEKLPRDNSIHKLHLQAFFKRLRKNTNQPLKYFACGEYGETTNRPHYHAILFCENIKSDVIGTCWGKGFVKIGTCTYDSCRYVCGYIQKKITGEKQLEHYGNRQAPFQLQSNGIGKKWCLDNKDYLLQNINITLNGKSVGVPKYYTKLIPELKPLLQLKAQQKQVENLKTFADNIDKNYYIMCGVPHTKKHPYFDLENRTHRDATAKALLALRDKKL